MKIKHFTLLLALPFVQLACGQAPPPISSSDQPADLAERTVGGGCECCDAWRDGLPASLSAESAIAPHGEPGEPLEVSGTIFKSDGKTPAEGVLLYVYHTDWKGSYSRGKGAADCARRHGLLRGWMRTGADGRYRFRTIRPASYPGTTIEAHIHPIIKEEGLKEYWIDEFLFGDDPLLTQKIRSRLQNRGGSGVLKLEKDGQGVWVGKRDIVLGLNVPGY